MGSCCISIDNFTSITDTISKILIQKELSKCSLNPKLIDKLETLKNLSINSTERFLALINHIKSDKNNINIEPYVNTFCNLANNIIELRNIVRELLEESSIKFCNDISRKLNEVSNIIGTISVTFSILALAALAKINNMSMNLSGKIASSLASLIFAFLLDIHTDNIRKALIMCYSTEIQIE
ncbi:MAG: hypothetical protein QW101_02660 [Ignisphaera sp.]|uniref:Uncharacterized protein n=1 Tax=Ignisphaera aggregans TaxID=334771 RepID=A0A7J3MZS1_9CREN